MSCFHLLLLAFHCAAFGYFGPCPPGTSVCYAVSDAEFQAGCEGIKGGYFKNTPSACVVPEFASQIVPCRGQSCTLIPSANFTVGCKSIGGFVSGALASGGVLPVCSARGAITQFMSCPPNVSCTVNPGFEDWCMRSKGFIDAFVNSLPECAVADSVNHFLPCNGSTSGCTYSGVEFSKACTGLGGMITATVSGGLPICPWGGPSCSFSMTEFTAACAKLGGFVMTNGGASLPQCAFKDVRSASN